MQELHPVQLYLWKEAIP